MNSFVQGNSMSKKNLSILMSFLLFISFLYITGASKLTANVPQLSLPTSAGNPIQERKVLKAYGKMPLYFVPNNGQKDRQVKYYAQGNGFNFFLTKNSATYLFMKEESRKDKKQAAVSSYEREIKEIEKDKSYQAYSLKIAFKGANNNPALEGQGKLQGKVNYFIGKDQSKWQRNLSTYNQVVYKNLYPGIDLVYKGDQKRIKYEFLVQPGADYKKINLAYSGATGLSLNQKGDLLIDTPFGQMKDEKPYIYQTINGKRVKLNGRFNLKGNNVGFSLKNYNPSYPLTIDPGLVYSTFLEGGTGDWTVPQAIAIDSSGNAYITGYVWTNSENLNFPITSGAYDVSTNDIFITKIDESGNSIVYSTFLGGWTIERSRSIAVDPMGNAYVAGETGSSDFPVTLGAYDPFLNNWDGFITKLDPSGSEIVLSTFLGGSDTDIINALSVDSMGNISVTGYTRSQDYPLRNAFDSNLDISKDKRDAFITKIKNSGEEIIFSSLIGGNNYEEGQGLASDSGGNILVTGSTRSLDFFTTFDAFDDTLNDGVITSMDAFIIKVSPSGSLNYSTFLGGSSGDRSMAIAIDKDDNFYVTGITYSTDFPTTNSAFDTIYNPYSDIFVTKFQSDGKLSYSSFLGGTGSMDYYYWIDVIEWGYSIAVDAFGNAYVTGKAGIDFPVTSDAFDSTYGNGSDAFVVKVNPSGSKIEYSSYLGGNSEDAARGIALDTLGKIYITGFTSSSDYPTITGAYDQIFDSNLAGFITKLSIPAQATTPQTLITDINQYLQTGDITNGGTATSLTSQVQNAQQSIDSGNTTAAIQQLEAFIKSVEAKSGNTINTDAANALIQAAQTIINGLQNP